jgi:hypothetical protein
MEKVVSTSASVSCGIFVQRSGGRRLTFGAQLSFAVYRSRFAGCLKGSGFTFWGSSKPERLASGVCK